MNMTPAEIQSALGAILALLFKYLPGLNTWYSEQSAATKSLTMLVLLAAATLGTGLYSQTGTFADWLNLFLFALITNQSAYLITRKL